MSTGTVYHFRLTWPGLTSRVSRAEAVPDIEAWDRAWGRDACVTFDRDTPHSLGYGGARPAGPVRRAWLDKQYGTLSKMAMTTDLIAEHHFSATKPVFYILDEDEL